MQYTFSVAGPGRAESYGVTQFSDTSRTFYIERYGFTCFVELSKIGNFDNSTATSGLLV
jgi:hypothetical protein